MQKLLILTASDPSNNPRPRRMIENLKDRFDVYAMGIGTRKIDRIKTFSFSAYTKRNFWQEMKLYYDALTHKWDRLIWTKNRREIVPFLEKYSFDFIICFDLPLLPIALKYKKQAKVIFDAQEYFPLWLTSNLRWRILFQRFNHILCKQYLPQADCVLSVSPSFVKRYKEEYGISPCLYLSLPYYYDLALPQKAEFPLKILYHGSLSANRSIKELIKVSDGLDERFELHLVLVGGEQKYRQKILKMIKTRQTRGQKIFIHPPVPFEEIVPFSVQFDIGLYFMPPKTYNLLATLPNKFFEYIASSLAIISTPNTDIVPFVEKYKIGCVSCDFSSESIVQLIESLSLQKVDALRLASYLASQELNNSKNQAVILKILENLNS